MRSPLIPHVFAAGDEFLDRNAPARPRPSTRLVLWAPERLPFLPGRGGTESGVSNH
jgi:hypothetical protein